MGRYGSDPGNIFAQGMDAFDQSYDRTKTMYDQQARQRAGRSLAAGNRQGAMQEFGNAGMTDDVRALQSDQTSAGERTHAQELETIKQRVGVLTQVGHGLKKVPQGGRRAELSKAAQLFNAAGMDTSWIESVTEDQLSDPAIDSIIGKAADTYKEFFHNPKFGIYGVQPGGKVDQLKAFPRDPLIVPQTSDIFMPTGGDEDSMSGGMGTDSLSAPAGADTISGGTGADTMRGGDRNIPGYSLVRSGRPPKGPAPKAGKEPAPVPPPEAGLRAIGNGFYKDSLGRVYQPNGSGVMQQVGGLGDTEVRKTVENLAGVNNILSSVDRFDAAIRELSPREYGPLGKYSGDPQKYARAKAAATDLMMTLKGPAGYNLGVITGPDMAIIESVVADPAKFDTMVRRGQIVPALTQLAKGLGQKRQSELEAFHAMGGDPAGLPGLYKSPRSQIGKTPESGSRPAASVTTKGGKVVKIEVIG